jgi:hypothetical protein
MQDLGYERQVGAEQGRYFLFRRGEAFRQKMVGIPYNAFNPLFVGTICFVVYHF